MPLQLSYEDNFTIGKQENNPEIFLLSGQTRLVRCSPSQYYFTPRAWKGWGFHHPIENFVEEFEANDPHARVQRLLSVGDSIPNQTNLIEITSKDAYQMFAGKEGQETGRMLPSNS